MSKKQYSSVSEMVRGTCSKAFADSFNRRLKRRRAAKEREIRAVLTEARNGKKAKAHA